VKVFFNGATSSTTTITLSGTIAAGACHVTAYSGSGSTLLAKANSTFTGSPWNGDDAIVLYQGTTVRDSIGRVGQDPGTAWGTTVTTVDSTLRRNASVVAGDTNTRRRIRPGDAVHQRRTGRLHRPRRSLSPQQHHRLAIPTVHTRPRAVWTVSIQGLV
jgi:hypothetical protein